MGFDKLAAMGADVALLQDQEADRIEASVIGAVRESHSPGMFGYVSAEEQKLLHRKTIQERMTTGQLETGFRTMLDRMYDEARNYGAEGDDDEEVGTGESFARMGAAFEVFGGDVPAVFGANAYQGLFDFLKPSADRLRKRLERKQRRLAKAESRLETLEDSGKKGVQVKWLRMKIKNLERSIARIESKLEKLDGAAEQVTNSAKKAKTIEAAEQTKVQEAAGPDMDMDEDDENVDFGLVAAADVYGLAPWRERRIRKRIRTLRGKLAKARRAGRRRKLSRRIRKLRARLTGRRRPAFRRRRARRQALTAPPMYGPSMYGPPVQQPIMPYSYPSYDEMPGVLSFGDDDDLGEDDDILYGLDDELYGASDAVKEARKNKRQAVRELKAAKAQRKADRLARRAARGGGGITLFSLPGMSGDDDILGDDYDLLGAEDIDLDEFGGEFAGRMTFVGFFERRADAMGGAQIGSDDPSFGGFWDNLKKWWQGLGQKASTEVQARKAGRTARRQARQPHQAAVRSTRTAYVEAEKARSKAGRKAWRQAYRTAKGRGGEIAGPRVVKGAGGYTYQQDPSGAITILEGPTGKGSTLSRGAAFEAITAEIGPHPAQAAVGAGFFQTLVTPGTNREKIQMLARELDQAIAKYGPESGVVDSLKQRMDDVQEEAELFGPDAQSTLDEDEDLDFDEMEAALG
jgi:hypothetical protein